MNAPIYDLRNQPKSISGTASGIYEYDGNKKRVKSVVDGKTLYFVYDASGKLMIVDRPDDSERVYYLHAAGKTMLRYTHRDNSSNSIDYLHDDHLGTANSASGSSGTVKWREQYSPFGERLSQIAANDDLDGFTGHVFDKATGLTYMQARYYDPLIGRFLSIDPVGFASASPGSFNRYAYTMNDPINAIDPDGMCDTSRMCQSSAGIATGGAGGGQQFGRPPARATSSENPSSSVAEGSSVSSGENISAGPTPSSIIVNPAVAAYLCPGKPGVCTVQYPQAFFQKTKHGVHGEGGHRRRSNHEGLSKGIFDREFLTDDQIAHMAEMTLRLGVARWAPGFNVFGRKVNITAPVPHSFGTEERGGSINQVFGLTMRVAPVKYRVWKAESLFPARINVP